MLFFAATVAFAGELSVQSAVPVNVWVDGTWVPSAQLSGLVGVHRVQVTSADDTVVYAETTVQVPPSGARAVVYDGVSLVVTAPAAPPQLVVVQAPRPAPVAAPAPTGPQPMSAGAFSALLAAVDDASFADDKLNAIRSAAAKNWFTIEQVGKLVDAQTYGSDQVSVVQVCAPRVVDPENAFALSPHFTYGSDKEAALAAFR
jgi:hypothetical protein